MVKNVKLSSANVRWYLRILSVAKTQNINSAPPITLNSNIESIFYTRLGINMTPGFLLSFIDRRQCQPLVYILLPLLPNLLTEKYQRHYKQA